MTGLIDWVEQAALENIRFHLQVTETLAKEAASTLILLLAGMGGALAYAVKGFEQATLTSLAVGAGMLSAWLMVVGCLLVIKCLLSTWLYAPTNEPKNLYQKDYSLDEMHEAELRNMQVRIEQVIMRNHRVAAWLDRSRLLALASPVVFVIAAAFSWVAR
ncbi:MAG: hypothetical protein M3H12_07765 [Chromatiales bacterium]|nr:hypothetical protein [Gammaproteobacteria bacterium]